MRKQPNCGHRLKFTSGANFSGEDFGNYKLARLTGIEFLDYNKNGLQNAGDTGLGGFVMYVDYNNNGKYDFAGAGPSELNPKHPAEATDPAVCGVLR